MKMLKVTNNVRMLKGLSKKIDKRKVIVKK